MYMDTKQGINQALKIIGKNGFSGKTVKDPSPSNALTKLLQNTKFKSNSEKILFELRRQSLVVVAKNSGSVKFTLTPAGAYRLQKVYVDEIQIEKPKKWDGKWRVVTFDVPNTQSKNRLSFTKHISKLGFTMIQKSLWVYPYPCAPEINKITDYYNLTRYCSFFTITEIDKTTLTKLKTKYGVN